MWDFAPRRGLGDQPERNSHMGTLSQPVSTLLNSTDMFLVTGEGPGVRVSIVFLTKAYYNLGQKLPNHG